MEHLTIDQLVRETYAVHHILRNLEFPAEDIYVGTPLVSNAETPGCNVVVQLRHDGKEFTLVLGPLRNDEEEAEYTRKWTEFSYSYTSKSKAELDKLIDDSVIWQNKVSILVGLIRKGFKLPHMSSEEDVLNKKWGVN